MTQLSLLKFNKNFIFKIELEKLNKSCDEINRVENELEVSFIRYCDIALLDKATILK